jgi:hypothetical protein
MDSRNKIGDMAGATGDNERNGMIDGWTPTVSPYLCLIDFAAGRIDADEYTRRVLDAQA